MSNSNVQLLTTLSTAFLVGVGFAAAPACGVADVCDLGCESDAFVNGQANISGVAGIDAFFGAALDLQTAMNGVNGELRARLDAIAVSVGLEAGAGGADIGAALKDHLSLYVDGGLSIEYAAPKCSASVEASVNAAAECDVEASPGSVSASCSGACRAEAGASVECSADAELECRGVAPELSCSGTCEGTCSLEFDGSTICEGTCNGSCDGNCELQNAMGECRGACDGPCTGRCELDMSAGAMCSGSCAGTCTYKPASGSCEADAEVSCRAMGDASIECEGSCEGEVEPPEVSAECEATVDAKAKASVECQPPTLQIAFTLKAGLAGDAEAEFHAWLTGFRANFAALLALRAQGGLLVDAAGNLGDAGVAALESFLDSLAGDADIKATAGAACALGQLPEVGTALSDAIGSLGASVSASAEFVASVGG